MTLSAADPFYVPPNVFCAGARKEVLVMPCAHSHDQVELNFLLRGGMTYAFGRETVRIRAGEFVFFWGVNPHQSIAVDPDTYFVCIYVPIHHFLSLPLGTRLTAAVLSGGVIAADQPNVFGSSQFERLHAELLGPDARLMELDRAELEVIFRRVDLTGWSDLLGRSLPGKGRVAGHEKAVAMAMFIHEHAREEIDATDVAASVGLHPNYAMTLFRSVIGCTIGSYLLGQRLRHATMLLSTTQDDVASIAFASGFGSVSRFYEAFARQIGVSPRRFRAGQLLEAV